MDTRSAAIAVRSDKMTQARMLHTSAKCHDARPNHINIHTHVNTCVHTPVDSPQCVVAAARPARVLLSHTRIHNCLAVLAGGHACAGVGPARQQSVCVALRRRRRGAAAFLAAEEGVSEEQRVQGSDRGGLREPPRW
jgi:hypothetical protein